LLTALKNGVFVQANYLSCSFHLSANHIAFVAGYLCIDIRALNAFVAETVLNGFLALTGSLRADFGCFCRKKASRDSHFGQTERGELKIKTPAVAPGQNN